MESFRLLHQPLSKQLPSLPSTVQLKAQRQLTNVGSMGDRSSTFGFPPHLPA